jgi:hypothetical protein
MDNTDATRLYYDWKPDLRVKLVTKDKREYEFPMVGKWLAVQRDSSFFATGTLNRRQCKALWRWLGRTDEPPPKLWIFLNREDFEKMLPPPKH